VVASARKLIGATNPLASEPGTIRGDFAIQVGRMRAHVDVALLCADEAGRHAAARARGGAARGVGARGATACCLGLPSLCTC
jgi:hypothetical protein